MKSTLHVFIVAAVLAGLLFGPFSVLPVSAESCGDTYTVQHGDYLAKIARTCGISLATIINANPEIRNINRVYPGQVIRLKVDSTIPVTGGTYTVVRGDYLSLIARRFGTTTSAILSVNPEITNPSRIYPGQVIRLPSDAYTTPLPAPPPYGTGGPYPYWPPYYYGGYYWQISLSTYSAKVGAQVEVTVRGFPANAEVDFRLGKAGQSYSVVVDGKTDSSGVATGKVTIPGSAVVGERWVVRVQTTSLAKGYEITSPSITIIS